MQKFIKTNKTAVSNKNEEPHRNPATAMHGQSFCIKVPPLPPPPPTPMSQVRSGPEYSSK